MFTIGEFTEIEKLVVSKGYEIRKNQRVTANEHRISFWGDKTL